MTETKIVYQDKDFLIIDKPANITVEDLANNLKDKINELKELPRYGLAHRIDKETSGVLIFAKNLEILQKLQTEFEERKIKKGYLTLVYRNMKETEGKIETAMRRSKNDRRKHSSYPIKENGRNAVSYYKVLENFENYSLIEILPETGRRHQIRSQMAYLGHTVVGDKLYRFKDQIDPEGTKRHFLHSHFVEINIDNKKKKFLSELPDDLKEIINKINV